VPDGTVYRQAEGVLDGTVYRQAEDVPDGTVCPGVQPEWPAGMAPVSTGARSSNLHALGVHVMEVSSKVPAVHVEDSQVWPGFVKAQLAPCTTKWPRRHPDQGGL